MVIRGELTHRDRFDAESGVHRFNSLVVLLKGEFEYTVNGDTRRLSPPSAVVFNKGTSFRKSVISPIDFLIVSSDEFVCERDSFLSFEDNGRFLDSVQRLSDAVKTGDDSAIEHFANDILLISSCNRRREENMLPAYKYISNNFTKNISLTFLSGISGCSAQTLISRFKKQYGKTPVKCIADFRIRKAKELLAGTDLPIGHIADMCGWENVYYFSNTFKSEVGISPTKYRQSTRL